MNDCPIGRGNRTGYMYGCGCQRCKLAHSEYTKQYRRGEESFVDEIAVERALNGTYPGRRLNRDERATAVALGERRGLTHREIARRMQLSDRTVVRYAAKLRAAA